jgi:hypothetical protein
MRLGANQHSYELVEPWPRLPDGMLLGYTHGVAADSNDRIYILNQSKDALVVFDRDGSFLRSWGGEFAKGAHGLCYSRQGKDECLWIADYEIPAVAKYTLEGKELLRLKTPIHSEYPKGEGYRPTHVCVAPNGDLYVCDGYGKNLVHRYDAGGKYLQSFGGTGSGPGQLSCPHGAVVDTRGPEPVLLVADRGNVRLSVFALDGTFLRTIADPAFRHPCNLHVVGDHLYIPDLFGVVQIFDRDYQVVELGAHPDMKRGDGWPKNVPGYPNVPRAARVPGTFVSPHDLCVDSHGDLYVVEWIDDGRITKLKKV